MFGISVCSVDGRLERVMAMLGISGIGGVPSTGSIDPLAFNSMDLF